MSEYLLPDGQPAPWVAFQTLSEPPPVDPRVALDRFLTNTFCPTGPGGGIDPHCPKGAAEVPAVQGPPAAKPPKSLPDEGAVEYLGFKLANAGGTQVGHRTEGGGLLSRTGIGTSRKFKGVSVTDPTGYERLFDNLKKAITWVHGYHGL